MASRDARFVRLAMVQLLGAVKQASIEHRALRTGFDPGIAESTQWMQDGTEARDHPRIRVVIAGWDYPDWVGPVYPVPRDGAASTGWPMISRYRRHGWRSTAVFTDPVAPASGRASWLRRTART